jgi:hypothetical protein
VSSQRVCHAYAIRRRPFRSTRPSGLARRHTDRIAGALGATARFRHQRGSHFRHAGSKADAAARFWKQRASVRRWCVARDSESIDTGGRPSWVAVGARRMTIELDHAIVSACDQRAAAKQLAELLGVSWSATGIGPFSAVYVNDGLTLDFINDPEAFPVQHFCFRVSDEEFDAILARLQTAEISYRSSVRGAEDRKIGTASGGRIVYWNEPDGHQWEILTVSYARPPR